jgi:hypothetical protein
LTSARVVSSHAGTASRRGIDEGDTKSTRPGRVYTRPGLAHLSAQACNLTTNYFAAGASAGGGVAGAAGAAASPAGAAGAAAASPAGAAGAAEESAGAAAAGGEAAGSVLAASCFAQAVSASAATSALRASLVFIDLYPEEEARVVRKRCERVYFRSASLYGSRHKFYRVPDGFETAALAAPGGCGPDATEGPVSRPTSVQTGRR